MLRKLRLKRVENYLPGAKQPIIAELWAVYGYYFYLLPIQYLYIRYVLQVTHIQPVSRLQLLLSNAY